MLSSRLLLELLLLAAPLTAAEADDSGPVVQIDAGKVKGVASQSHGATVNKFLGIPYAEPPLNQLRFATPESIKPWNGTLNALHQPNACIQYYGAKGPARDMTVRLYDTPAPPGQSEDCLYLNVYVPEGGEKNKSVLFWIHGGSGVQGAASLPLYDGTSFAARQDLIVVAINYRLNGIAGCLPCCILVLTMDSQCLALLVFRLFPTTKVICISSISAWRLIGQRAISKRLAEIPQKVSDPALVIKTTLITASDHNGRIFWCHFRGKLGQHHARQSAVSGSN